MMYVVRGWVDGKNTGSFRAERDGRNDALETALAVRSQGIDHVSIEDETGRVFTLPEFEVFCAEDSI